MVINRLNHQKNMMWSSEDRGGKMSTPHERMRPAFASNRSLVVIPFRSRVVPQLPKSHRQVNGKRFGNRFTEVVYLHTSDKMSPIHMFDMMSHKVMIVSDFRHSCLKSDTVGYPTNSLSATSTAQYTHPTRPLRLITCTHWLHTTTKSSLINRNKKH